MLRAAAVCGLLAAFACGCAKEDNRISRQQLESYEFEIAEQADEPAAVDVGRIALKEVQPYQVGPGDELNVKLGGLDGEYSQVEYPVRVHSDGTILLPMIGKLNVAGRDLARVEEAVYQAYVPDFVPRMTVFVQVSAPEETTVVVVGATAQPGIVALPRDQRNVIYAVARAGGFQIGTAGTITVKPVRPGREPASYDLTDINDLRRALTAAPLESGDMVEIDASATPVIFVTGLVNMPGPIPLPANTDLSVVRAVASAGGLVDLLNPSEATLWRRLADGRQVRAKLEIGEIMTGQEPDMALLPGDILDIPHTAETRLRQWAIENIQFGPFGVTAVYDPVADYRARLLRDDGNNFNILRSTLLGGLQTGLNSTIQNVIAP